MEPLQGRYPLTTGCEAPEPLDSDQCLVLDSYCGDSSGAVDAYGSSEYGGDAYSGSCCANDYGGEEYGGDIGTDDVCETTDCDDELGGNDEYGGGTSNGGTNDEDNNGNDLIQSLSIAFDGMSTAGDDTWIITIVLSSQVDDYNLNLVCSLENAVFTLESAQNQTVRYVLTVPEGASGAITVSATPVNDSSTQTQSTAGF